MSKNYLLWWIIVERRLTDIHVICVYKNTLDIQYVIQSYNTSSNLHGT